MTPCMISLAIRAGSSGYRARSHHHGGTPNLSDCFEISQASHLRHSASSLLMFLRTILVLQYNYDYTTLHYNTLDYTTLYHATVHYNTNCTTPQLQLQLRYTNYTTLQQLTTTTPLHFNYNYTYKYNYNCTTPHCIQQLW